MIRAPVQPTGWPMEMPLPFKLHLSQLDRKLPHAGDRLAGEGLVEFDEVDVLHREAELTEEFPGCRDRAESHVGGIHAARGIALDPGERLETQFLGLVGGHDDDRGGAVIDPGGVSGGDCSAVLLEGGRQFGHLFQRGVHGTLIDVEGNRRPLLLGDHDGDDLIGHGAARDGGPGPLMAQERHFILLAAG